jgi:hypothetical protein
MYEICNLASRANYFLLMKKITLSSLALICLSATLSAQNVAINGTGAAPAATAMLDVSSTTTGLLIPRMTSVQRTAIAAPATGLYVYDTTTGSFWYYDGLIWQEQLNGSIGWRITGNATAAANFIGTTNAQAFRFYANNVERMRINPTDGEIVAGATASPYAGDMVAAVGTATLTFAINGYSAFNGSGTWGEVLAASTTAFSAVQGVYGGSGAGAGTLGNYNGTGTGNTRAGVVGVCSTPAANAGGAGVYGYNAIASGNQRMGVLGTYNGSAFGIGVHGIAFGGGIITGNFDIAVVGWRANNANYSGYFNGNHVIANGTKTASVGTQWGNQLLYCQESPEVWFEDIGGGKLVNGQCRINLDSIYLDVTVIDETHPMHVFIQLEGECEDVYVIKDSLGFLVKEKNGGHSNTSFSYRVSAKRVNFQDHRYGNDPVWGAGDTRAYMQYAPPPPIDYATNVKFQEDLKKNWKQTPMPAGFITWMQIQEEAQKIQTTRGTAPQPTQTPAPAPAPAPQR